MSVTDTRVIGDYPAAISIDGDTHYLLIQPGSSSTAYNKINRSVFLGVNGQPADISTSQNFTNKTLDDTNTITVKDSLLTLQDDSDSTKQGQFQLSGLTTSTTRIYALPDASTTLVGTTLAQTLTNKTLTSPVITGGSISNSTISVDSIGEYTAANGVTIDGLNIKDGALNTNNSVISSSIMDGAIVPNKILAGTGTGWTWTPFTPSFTNLTIGNGTTSGSYTQIGKTVIGVLLITLGNTSSVGTGPYFVPPVTANAFYNNGSVNYIVGQTLLANASIGAVAFAANSARLGWFYNSAVTTLIPITATAPVSWTATNTITTTFCYQAA